jgi:hypothetical protein
MSVLFYYERGWINHRLWPHKPVSHIMMDRGWNFDRTEVRFMGLFYATVKHDPRSPSHCHVIRVGAMVARTNYSNVFPEEDGAICIT